MIEKAKLIAILFLVAIIAACNGNEKIEKTETDPTENKEIVLVSSIDILDNDATQLIDSNATVEVLAGGFSWSEGPVWVDDLNAVLFSDVPKNKIYKWSEADSLTLYLDSAGSQTGGDGPNGLLLDSEGDLLICQHGDRRVALMSSGIENPTNEFVSIAEKYNDKKYNSPNDLDMDSVGNLYFTDPPYGQPNQQTGEIGVNGVFRVKANGDVTLLIDSLTRPNGIALSLDEKTLYVNNSDPQKAFLCSYQIGDDGKLKEGKILFNMNPMMAPEKNGLPDGLKVHKSGNIFATGPGGVHIISPEGTLLGTIKTERATANCAFDTEQEYLYLTTTDLLLRVKLKN